MSVCTCAGAPAREPVEQGSGQGELAAARLCRLSRRHRPAEGGNNTQIARLSVPVSNVRDFCYCARASLHMRACLTLRASLTCRLLWLSHAAQLANQPVV